MSPTARIVSICYDPTIRSQIDHLVQQNEYENVSHFFREALDWAKPQLTELLLSFKKEKLHTRRVTTFHLRLDQVKWLQEIIRSNGYSQLRSSLIMHLSLAYLETIRLTKLFHPVPVSNIATLQISTNPNQIQFSDGTIKHLIRRNC